MNIFDGKNNIEPTDTACSYTQGLEDVRVLSLFSLFCFGCDGPMFSMNYVNKTKGRKWTLYKET